jgi:serine/threonine protein kinase
VIRPFAGLTTNDIENEVRALDKLCRSKHPNIVQVLNYGLLQVDSAFFFIDMELSDILVTLERYVQGQIVDGLVSWERIRQDEKEVIKHAYTILQQILNGLIYIHSLREVRPDLTPHNGQLQSHLRPIASATQKQLLENCGFRPDSGRHLESVR